MANTSKQTQPNGSNSTQPNILFITVDQMRYPDFSEGGGGMIQPLKEIFGFTELSDDNPYIDQFPGFMRLRKNAVTLQNHHIAASACVPSRATIYTGQYGTRTQVMETDSLFKFGSDPNFPWLDPRGVPTIGDWLRAAGYDTHYFGKWDLSYADVDGPANGDINEWGFADWKLSSPDAQGGQLNQLGVYRDPGYADMACDFLRRKGMNYEATPNSPKPWFATVSLVNPHDIASAYPISWWMPEELEQAIEELAEAGITAPTGYGVQTIDKHAPYNHSASPKPVPAQGSQSNPLPGGSVRVDLNPDGFGTDECLFKNPQSLHDDLTTKPDCQFEYSYKMGLALKSRRPELIRDWQTLPFQAFANNHHPELMEKWFQAYGQFYAYLHTLADRQIDRVLKTLDDTGLTENTIVVFLSDHGEYAGAQGGMIEKWHTAYDQILHVPTVFSSPLLNTESFSMNSVSQFTSHIDILPTLLGFAGYDSYEKQHQLGLKIKREHDQTYIPLPGVNLQETLQNPEAPICFPQVELNKQRQEVLFVTDDTITEHLKGEAPTRAYHQFMDLINQERSNHKLLETRLTPGPIVQPNHIRCVKLTMTDVDDPALQNTTWKLARYWDPSGKESDQWEFYFIDQDPAERNNLVTWRDSLPELVASRIPAHWKLSQDDVQQALCESRNRLVFLEKLYLEPVSPFEEAYVLESITE